MRAHNILIVDNDEENRAVIENFLAEEGLTIFTETNPQKVIDRINNDHIQIVICEMRLHGEDGIHLLKQIKSYDCAIQVIMTAGYVKISDILACRNAGAVGFLFKPYENIPDFLKEIHDAEEQIDKWEAILLNRKNYSAIVSNKDEK